MDAFSVILIGGKSCCRKGSCLRARSAVNGFGFRAGIRARFGFGLKSLIRMLALVSMEVSTT